MTDAAAGSSALIQRDTRAFKKKDEANIADLIAFAARKSGRSAFAIGHDMIRYSLGKSRLRPSEYVMYGLFDLDRHTPAERAAFISAELHGKTVSECIDYGWYEVAGDKWLSSVFLAADATPQPRTLAVVDQGARVFQGVHRISTPDGLRDFLIGEQDFPLFCKYNNGYWSLGANVITAADRTHLHLQNVGAVSFADFFRDYVGHHTFLIQNFVRNHSFLQQFTPSTATVRMVNMWRDDGLWTPHALLKLPSAGNVADNFWRDGNLICQLDVDTGEVLTVVGRDGPELVRYDTHPQTGKALIGQRLPHWQKLRDLNERVAALHHPMRYTTQDIAIAEDGPVEIEFNWGGAFELPQIATGKGFMTPEVRDFFRACGSTRV